MFFSFSIVTTYHVLHDGSLGLLRAVRGFLIVMSMLVGLYSVLFDIISPWFRSLDPLVDRALEPPYGWMLGGLASSKGVCCEFHFHFLQMRLLTGFVNDEKIYFIAGYFWLFNRSFI